MAALIRSFPLATSPSLTALSILGPAKSRGESRGVSGGVTGGVSGGVSGGVTDGGGKCGLRTEMTFGLLFFSIASINGVIPFTPLILLSAPYLNNSWTFATETSSESLEATT